MGQLTVRLGCWSAGWRAEPNNDIFTIVSPSMSKIWVTFHAKNYNENTRKSRRNHKKERLKLFILGP